MAATDILATEFYMPSTLCHNRLSHVVVACLCATEIFAIGLKLLAATAALLHGIFAGLLLSQCMDRAVSVHLLQNFVTVHICQTCQLCDTQPVLLYD